MVFLIGIYIRRKKNVNSCLHSMVNHNILRVPLVQEVLHKVEGGRVHRVVCVRAD